MTSERKNFTILLVEDDPVDTELLIEALQDDRLVNEIKYVRDGTELMNYLRQEDGFGDKTQSPRPDLILLDLNLPKMDGREALKEVKSDPNFRRIPVIVMTTSRSEEDIYLSYNLGANSYIVKPFSFDSMVEIIRSVKKYWFDIVELTSK